VVVRLLQKFDKIQPGAHELEGYVRSGMIEVVTCRRRNANATTGLNLTNAPGKKVTLMFHEAARS
jgi:hypothetical protein